MALALSNPKNLRIINTWNFQCHLEITSLERESGKLREIERRRKKESGREREVEGREGERKKVRREKEK